MKSIFGFLTGAAVGVGGLFGLRKVLNMMDSTEAAAPSSPTGRPVSYGVEDSPSKAEKHLDTSNTENRMHQVTADLEKTQETMSKLEELISMSMVGEPAERHQEPIAAIESAPEAVTPRSETAEEAVPEKVEVEPANTAPTQPKVAVNFNTGEGSNGRKSSRTPRPSRTDDFTTILDIGPVFNQKLHEAGIKSFKALARLTPAQIEEKTGIPADRIENGKWLEQVQKILAGESKE